jgi:signal transduction histidine kinase
MARPLKRGSLSLGMRAFVAGALLFIAPLAYVGVSMTIETELAARTETRERQCAAAIVVGVEQGAQLEDIAAKRCDPYRFRVEVVDASGERTVSDALERSGPNDRIGDVLYGKERVEYLARMVANSPPPEERAEVIGARADGESLVCSLVPEANLRICALARRVDLGDGARVVDVVGASRSARLARYGERRELAAMLVFGAVAASALILWLRHLVTGPVHSLARDVDAQARAATTGTALDESRPRELAEVARAFNRLREALARADAQNEAFLADLAHEMKNPVAAIAAAAEALESPPASTTAAATSARTTALLKSISSSASRLDRLVRQFLDLARAEAGLATEERERVNLGELVKGVTSTIDEARVAVDASSDGGGLDVSCAVTRVESAVRNLIDNALAFARERVLVLVRREGSEIVLDVVDDGAGIRAEDLPHVFERFFSARGDGKGTGLGLAIVRAVTEAHGGRVEVKSGEGGTTFSLRFPAA